VCLIKSWYRQLSCFSDWCCYAAGSITFSLFPPVKHQHQQLENGNESIAERHSPHRQTHWLVFDVSGDEIMKKADV